jgi:hypothetical protein
MDFFEINRVLEELPRTFAAPCATTWFKVTENANPSSEEYRDKVVSFMRLFENAFSSGFPEGSVNTKVLREFIDQSLRYQISNVLSGSNKEVEKRYKYYVNHGY